MYAIATLENHDTCFERGIVHRWFFWSVFFIISSLYSTSRDYSVNFNSFSVTPTDTSVIPEYFTVVSCLCTCSYPVLEKEIMILLEIHPGASLTREQFLKGVERLRQKERFTQGIVTFTDVDGGCAVTVTLECNWIVKFIKLEGVSTDKDEYLRHYELAGGDPFVKEKHDHSCKAIQNFLAELGYRNAHVIDRLMYDEVTKTVTVILGITKGAACKVLAVDYTITDTENSFFSADALIQKKSQKLINKTCSKEKLDTFTTILKKSLQDKGYRDVTILLKQQFNEELTSVSVRSIITLGKRKKTTFFGNHFFSSDALYKKRIEFPAEEIPAPLLVMGQEVEDEYRSKGFLRVAVETWEDDKGQEFFVVKEGIRYAIQKIQIKGVTACEVAWLEKSFFKDLKRNTYIDEEKLSDALSAVKNWYKKQGFWDIQILKPDYKAAGESSMILDLTFNEGMQKKLESIVVPEDEEATTALFSSQKIDLTKGAVPFLKEWISAQRTFLVKYYQDQGYTQVKVTHLLAQKEQGVALVWNVEKGKKGFFKHTILRGYTSISYDRLMSLLSYKEGDVWNKNTLQQSVTSLRSLGVFERVNSCPVFKQDTDSQRDIILMLKDDDPFEIKLRAGFAQVSNNHLNFKKGSTYTAGGSFIWKNPRAFGDKVLVEVDFNRFQHRFNTSYTIPLIGMFPVATIFKGYANKYIQPIYIGSSKPLYQVIQQGFLAGFSKKRGHCDLGLTAGFEWMETNDISLEVARAIDFDPELVDKKIPYIFIEPMLYADFLDDKVNPTKGFFFVLGGKGMFPFKKSSYLIKFIAEQGAFIPVRSSVLALRFRAGHIFGRQFSAIMPPERFYLGGPNSIRAYVQDYCPPLGTYVTEQGEIQDVPRGGKTMLNANIELRFPVNGQFFWGTLFQDFGILVGKHQELFQGSHPLAATGFGIRYLTPVGTLRFDIGWKWHKERPEASSYAWFLAFGNAF